MSEQSPTVEDVESAFRQRDRLEIARQMAGEWAMSQRPPCPQSTRPRLLTPAGGRSGPGCSCCGTFHILARLGV